MNARRMVAPAVIGLASILGIVGGLQVVNTGSDYARLFPDPEAVPWTQGRAETLWLETNLPGVELRVSGLEDLDADANADEDDPALGLGRVFWRDPETNLVHDAGQGDGCQDAYGHAAVTVDDPATMKDERTGPYSAFPLMAGHGVNIIPCVDENADPGATSGMVALYAPDGERLAEYGIETPDPGLTPLATPIPIISSANNRAPEWTEGDYALRVICVDQGGDRADFFDGLPAPGEKAGHPLAILDPNGDALDVSLAAEGDYAYFAIDETSGDYQIRLSDLAPNDDTGLDVERLYELRLLADDGRGGRDSIAVTVQVDESRVATGTESNGNTGLQNDERGGICP